MSTELGYNDVLLRNCTTREWDAEVLYDPSGTCYAGTRYRVTVEAIVHTISNSSHGVFVGTSRNKDNPALQLSEVLRRLREPQQFLGMTIGGRSLLRAYPSNSSTAKQADRDVANGPKPRDVRITHIAGDKGLRILFTVETTLYDCPGGPPLVTAHRWSISEATDENWFTTRTVRGRMTFTAPQLVPGHDFRNRMPLGLEVGFKRVSVEFTVAEDGLSAEYTIVDRQVHTSAPYPATKISGTHQEGTEDGVFFTSLLSVRLEGPPHEDKRLLVQRLLQIANNRLNWVALTQGSGKDGKPQALLVNATMTDHFGEQNAVEMTMYLRHASKTAFPSSIQGTFATTLDLAALLIGNSAVPNSAHDPLVSRRPDVFGYTPHKATRSLAVLYALHAAGCGDLCKPDLTLLKSGTGQKGSQPGSVQTGSGTVLVGKVSPILAPLQSTAPYSDGHQNGMYTMHKLETKYTLDEHSVQMPIARAVGSRTERTSVKLTLARPTSLRITTVEAERVGAEVEFPVPLQDYKDGSLRGRLLRHEIVKQPPHPTPDGNQLLFYARGIYVYMLDRPPTTRETVAVGFHPFMTTPFQQTRLDPATLYVLT